MAVGLTTSTQGCSVTFVAITSTSQWFGQCSLGQRSEKQDYHSERLLKCGRPGSLGRDDHPHRSVSSLSHWVAEAQCLEDMLLEN